MGEIRRPDGVEIHYELRGDGPLIAFAPYWSWSPGVFDEVFSLLAEQHSVLIYHARGTGLSSRQGPYDMQTDSDDLEALLDEVGAAGAAFSLANSSNWIVRVAERRPDLIANAVCTGNGPFSFADLEGGEGMMASKVVIDALFEQLRRDYRGAMRSIVRATNVQMSDDEVRERVGELVEFCPQKPGLERNRAWLDDDPTAEARALGARLHVFVAPGLAGPWLPPPEQEGHLTRKLFPEAIVTPLEAGLISDPQGGARALTEIAASVRS